MKSTGLRAGTLRHTLVFQENTPTDDSFGAESVDNWTDAFEVPGAYEPLASREFPTQQKRYSETTARFRIRYRPGIDAAKHRVLFYLDRDNQTTPQIFNIYPPQPVEGRRAELLIEASEII
jgi:head-tail adaptor